MDKILKSKQGTEKRELAYQRLAFTTMTNFLSNVLGVDVDKVDGETLRVFKVGTPTLVFKVSLIGHELQYTAFKDDSGTLVLDNNTGALVIDEVHYKTHVNSLGLAVLLLQHSITDLINDNILIVQDTNYF